MFSDALYFRSLGGIDSWLALMPESEAREKVFMLVLAALAYGYADYATATLDEPALVGYFG